MVINNKFTTSREYIGLGIPCAMLGFVFLIVGGAFGEARLLAQLFSNQSAFDFTRGFFIGISIIVCTVSIYLNIRGILLYRKEQTQRE